MHSNMITVYYADAEQLAALRLPFPVSDVKKRTQGGAELSYYEHHTVQNRLLDVFGSGVSLTTGVTMTDKETNTVHVEVLVEVEWVSGRKSKLSGWGTSTIMKSGDHFKSAFSDGLKVAISKLGCGLELYDARYRDGLTVRLKELEDQEAERAFVTCQECNREILAGSRPKPDGSVVEVTAKQIATSTRNKFGRRLCMCCAEKRQQSEKSIVSVPVPAIAAANVDEEPEY